MIENDSSSLPDTGRHLEKFDKILCGAGRAGIHSPRTWLRSNESSEEFGRGR